ncbi:MAG: amino acid adenylation domain-containing protein [Burkholderia sp.]|uniref:non-ribosomal peptide synthetase n=6 Tax=Burkholderia sp. TaxID=36773 RepID=UPI002586E788|nr:non-ribosomal peptide synthetase [Burkholderia sp.]MCA3783275.1 amino acid adenylation domain-containing protein [Burkholderia sp.]MCA3787294.1 amino acid adenylation domain-containing protein [Burkholderia sp.]MCA3793592.1 amino acid adenylation domain-containing protein [Burkholderia sp.]MCA3802256.1 amino acid adenylation domain-containing protein [Burkholderia sp.]MCA3807738.1 amino acid adenylation domain-containing protein [Burkholderia sp.]
MTSPTIADIYELSPMQEAMLFHAVHSPDARSSFNQLGCRITGSLDPALFQAAWQQLIDRHPVMRTSFHWEEFDKPMQVVHAHATLPWVQDDWRDLPEHEQRARWRAHLENDLAEGFALDRAPLVRCRLVRVAEHAYLFSWSHHHILADGWCLSLVIEEIFEAYRALAQGVPPALPAVRPYRDYIQWLQQHEPDAAQQYWARYLEGFHSPTPLPTAAHADAGERFGEGLAQVQAGLSADLSARLRQFAARHHVTLNTLAQAAWALVLSRYSGETDVVFGAVVSGRGANLPGIESMLGLFINTVPVRVRVDPRQPLVPWLKMIQARVAARAPFEHTPLPDIQRCSEVPLTTPLFESNITFMNYPLDASLTHGAHGLAVDEVELYNRADIPLEFVVTARDDWKMELSFDPRRFDEDTMQRMLGHVAATLDAFAADPNRLLGRLPILPEAERRQLLDTFNDTAVPFDAALTVVHRLEQAAAAHPERPAVEYRDSVLSIGELNARANRIAHRLLAAAELGPDALVAICMHRSAHLMEVILAVWKCGAAYIPIDPNYPAARIRTILEDSGATLVITCDGLLPPELTTLAPVVSLDAAAGIDDDTNPGRPVLPGSLAYVIYTSGSTGKPKGAMVEHAGMLNHMLAEIDEFSISASSVIAQTAPHCFDISVWQFFTALLAGGKTVMVDDECIRDPASFVATLEATRVSILELVPSYLSAVLDRASERPTLMRHLRHLLVTGEMVSPALVKQWFDVFPDIAVVNAYGPAEASDDVAQHRMTCAPTTPYVPVGKPIRNVRLYVVDPQMNLCPIGIPGELCVSGIAVGRGYLNNEAATREAFVEDPFHPERGVRLYRTSDIGCYLPDGTIALYGRKDHQLKIRGYRIELGEIDNALAAIPEIRQAAALDYRDDAGRAALCAYVAFRDGASLSDAAMAAALSATLPDYMVPAIYVVLDALPLSSNGKIDRKALPPLDRSRLSAAAHAPTPPRTPTETLLCRIWGEALGIPLPGIHDNLFALGGDSILSMRIVSLAAKAGLKLTTRLIFQHPTVAELAAVATRGSVAAAEFVASSGPLPLTPIQKRFFAQHQHDPDQYNQAVLLDVPADFDPVLLRQALRHAVKWHDALRLRFRAGESGWIQSVVDDPEVPVGVFDLPRDQLAQHVAQSHASLNLSDGPVVRADLFRLDEGRSLRLLLVAHHLVVDGVSWGALLETLYDAYSRLRNGKAPEFAGGSATWTAWTQAISRWAGTGAADTDLVHWQALARANLPGLPLDRAAPADSNTVSSAETIVVELGEAATTALLGAAPRAYDAQINDMLLAALARAVSDWSGCADVLLDLEAHGREELIDDLDISRTVGWFTSVFPVALTVDPGPHDPARLVASVKTQLRAVPSAGISYGLLQDRLDGPPAQPQLLFNYLGQTDQLFAAARDWKPATEPSGDGRHANQRREHLLDINAYVSGNRLHVAWEFSRACHDADTIRRVAQAYIAALESLVADPAVPSASAVPATGPAQVPASVMPDEVADVYALTPTQQGMLFHGLYEPASDAYFSSLNFRIDGALDTERFRRAWDTVAQRHDILRTSFHWEDLDSPVQVVHRGIDLPWHEEDLRAASAAQAEQRRQTYDAQDRARGFNFTRAPLMRLALFRVDDHAWRFHWSHHHILLDGWSSARLLGEVAAAYQVLPADDAPEHHAPPAFAEYVRWLARQDAAAAERFWRTKLADFPATTPLVLGRPELDGTAAPGAYVEEPRLLSESDTQRLVAFAQTRRLTLNTLVQGAWAQLLGRYSGETDVVFGTIVSGRPASLPASDEMVGLFINTLPVRVRIDARPTSAWLAQLQMDLAQQEEYAHYPLADIQKFAGLPPGVPLFESLLIFQNYPVEEALADGLPGLRIGDFQVADPNNYPLTLVVTPGKRLSLQVLYDDGRFDRDTIVRLLGHVETLLVGLAGAEDRPNRSVALLTAAQRDAIVLGWNDTFAPVPSDRTLPELIEAVAAAHPERIAVRCGTEVRTYRDLFEGANRIAAHLLHVAPIQPDDRIAVWMPRSPLMLETILAIWKCGAAYVPVDPAYPAQRVETLLTLARPALIVATDGVPQSPAALAAIPRVDPACLPELRDAGAPALRCRPADLAYVIFTSGSTGQPKGAMVEHRGMLNHVLAMARRVGLGTQSAVAQTASHCSDISVWQCFAALVSGGTTVLYPDAVILEPASLIDALHRDRITAMQFVPSYLATFLGELERHPAPLFPHLDTLLTIGETLQPASAHAWFRLNPAVRLINAYGPTEASDSVAHFSMERAPDLPAIPIGRPIDNLRLYVVDADMNPCPAGVKGEICIGGAGVGRGYLFDEARTRAVFRDDPFSPEPGARLYRTGDIGCFGADGTLHFFGRRDFQVKIRGYRIELGEIEAALTGLAGISNAVVVARQAPDAEMTLCGYASGTGWTPQRLRDALRDMLPAHMVPDTVMLLPALPVMPNGKINRAALPLPNAASVPDGTPAEPQTSVEAALLRIFAEVLGRRPNGIDDDFFEHGGQSLKAIQMVSRIRRELKLDVAVADIFQAPSPRALARKLASRPAERLDGDAPIPALAVQPSYAVSRAQKRIWLASRSADPSTYNMAGALQLDGAIDTARLVRAFDALVDRHESLRTVFAMIEGELRQRILTREASGFRVEHLDLADDPALQAIDALIREESGQPFDLASGPLLRVKLVRLAPTEHLLLLNMHHVISDAWSIRVLTDDLQALYAGHDLPPLSIQYRDYAAWHNASLDGPRAAAHRAYWLAQLEAPLPRLQLASDFPRPERPGHAGQTLDVELPEPQVAGLAALARAHHTSLYTVLLASFCVLMHRYTGREDIVIGSVSAGRDSEQLESQIGVFLNTVVLRIPVQKSATVEAVIDAVAKASTDALEHASYPFDALLDDLKIRTPAGHFPIFDIQANAISMPAPQSDLRITDRSQADTTAKFDLSFQVVESDGRHRIQLIYNANLFRPATIAAMRDRLLAIHDAFRRDPAMPVDRILLSGDAPAASPRVRVGLRLKRAPEVTADDVLEEKS